MPTYRVYMLSKDEHITRPPRLIACPNDESAVRNARRFLDGHVLEVWDEKRRIARLVPDHDGPP